MAALALGACGTAATHRWRATEAQPLEGIARALAEQGLTVDVRDVCWIDPPPSHLFGSFTHEIRAIARAHIQNESADIYLVRVRMTPEGRLLSVAGAYDLSHTSGADEGAPLCAGRRAFYTVSIDGVFTAVHALDVDGEPPPQWPGVGRLDRAQNALTNLQETGQLEGVGRRSWSLDPSATSVAMRIDGDQVRIEADGHRIVLPVDGLDPREGASFVRARAQIKARPGNLVTWAVDRVRAFSWFGDDRMQMLKAVVFAGLDRLNRVRRFIGGDNSASEIASDLGDLARVAPVTYTDPETGWPPAPIKPLLVPPLAGEGQWMPVAGDPFVQENPGVPPAFLTTFVRLDRERAYDRVYITLWDPRQVQMHMMAGTVEPIGATGEAGPGLVPRTPEVMRRLVGAFNGGFQAMHGEFGMMGDGVVYLPPKPFAATAALLKDGSNGFGEWPRSPEIPDDIVSYRQNMTALVLDEKFNPYGRTWWGGTPPGWKDKTHSVRTGICLTRENFIGYFYGAELDAETLAQAMIRTRCRFGIHLDMNAGHTGLELYRVGPTGTLPPLARPLEPDWQAEGTFGTMDGWTYRARLMIRHMNLMNFPRYIHREARDFFYLTLRPVLPGPPLVPGATLAATTPAAVIGPASADDGQWRVRGLPQHGFPYAIALTTVRADPSRSPARFHVLKIDPRTVRAAGTASAAPDAPTVVVFSGTRRSKGGSPALWLADGAFVIAPDPPPGAASPTQIFSGLPSGRAPADSAIAAVGIDEDGMLAYVEPAERGAPRDAAMLLDRLLDRLGCKSRMLLAGSANPALGGTTTLDGAPAPAPEGTITRLVRGSTPGAHPIFENTPIVPIQVWHPLQEQRVRYFKKPDAGAGEPGSKGAASDTP